MVTKLCIVIPVYRRLTRSDTISLRSLAKGELRHKVILIMPRRDDNIIYDIKRILKTYDVEIKLFNSSYFESKQMYSRLLLSRHFYKNFLDYDYMLVYQLDCLWLGNGSLEEFVRQGYIYLGAPWIKSNKHTKGLLIGNGGFSLRHINTFYKWLTQNIILGDQEWLNYNYYSYSSRIKYCWLIIKEVLKSKRFKSKTWIFDMGILFSKAEDVTFSRFIKENKFKVPSLEMGAKFSFEQKPVECFQINQAKLPLGCHAWERYDKEFWLKEVPWLRDALSLAH